VIFLVREITSKFDINSLLICPPHLHAVATLPWEIKQVIFQQYYSYVFLIIFTLSQNKTKYNCYSASESFISHTKNH